MDVSSLKNQNINPRIIRPSDTQRSQRAKALKTPGEQRAESTRKTGKATFSDYLNNAEKVLISNLFPLGDKGNRISEPSSKSVEFGRQDFRGQLSEAADFTQYLNSAEKELINELFPSIDVHEKASRPARTSVKSLFNDYDKRRVDTENDGIKGKYIDIKA
ncbi:MAG: hypothetical protein GF307_07550 [candidate division Zixibacteria bacterium]|nr:hypothetical protein [candidate division Zixibacteria bacterium]